MTTNYMYALAEETEIQQFEKDRLFDEDWEEAMVAFKDAKEEIKHTEDQFDLDLVSELDFYYMYNDQDRTNNKMPNFLEDEEMEDDEPSVKCNTNMLVRVLTPKVNRKSRMYKTTNNKDKNVYKRVIRPIQQPKKINQMKKFDWTNTKQ